MVVCSIATSTINTTIEWLAPLQVVGTIASGQRHCMTPTLTFITRGGSDTAYSTLHDGSPHHYVYHYHSITQGGSDTAFSTLLFINTNT